MKAYVPENRRNTKGFAGMNQSLTPESRHKCLRVDKKAARQHNKKVINELKSESSNEN